MVSIYKINIQSDKYRNSTSNMDANKYSLLYVCSVEETKG